MLINLLCLGTAIDMAPRHLQVSLIQLDNYGPWTVTPGPRREPDLQRLQARLFADVAEFAADHDGYAFPGRYDNMVVVSNGIRRSTHEHLQARIRREYPVTASVSIGEGTTPVAAIDTASHHLQAAGSAQQAERREVLVGEVAPKPLGLMVAHFDIVNATNRLTDEMTADQAYLTVAETSLALSKYVREHHDAFAQFMGGDNVIAIYPYHSDADVTDALEHVRETVGIEIQVGIGYGRTASQAGYDAKHALERCREEGTRIERINATPGPE